MALLRRLRPADSLVGRVAALAGAHRVTALAAESAFYVALAVFPTLLTVVAVVRAAGPALGPGADRAAVAGLTGVLRLVLTARGSAAAEAAETLLGTSSAGVLTLGTVVALLLLVRALRSILRSLAVVADRPPRSWRAAALLAVVLLTGAATITAVVVQDPLRTLAGPAGAAVWWVLRWPAIGLALVGWAALLLQVGTRPPRRSGRRTVLTALAVTVAWCGASALFPLYVSLAARFTGSLGALGGGLILLLWLYLLILSLYLGAAVVQVLDVGAGRRRKPA
jgi:membrane protein